MINSLVAHLVFLQKNNLALGIKENLKVFLQNSLALCSWSEITQGIVTVRRVCSLTVLVYNKQENMLLFVCTFWQ